MTVQIIEIMGRSNQGMTRPFICCGDDGHTYFVKGRGATRRSQICEWIAGHLALKLHLPIAPFEIVEVSPELLSIASDEASRELGEGPAFGSRKSMVVELSKSQLPHVSAEVQRDVLAFDWWVRNGDRNLTETGGNPNLFWDVEKQLLVVIDHNQAFDPNFSTTDFFAFHVFSGQRHALFGDWVLRQEYNTRLAAAMVDWSAICHTIPPTWWFIDVEQTIPTEFDLNEIRTSLMRFQDESFWSQL
jgi:hypothetical protein